MGLFVSFFLVLDASKENAEKELNQFALNKEGKLVKEENTAYLDSNFCSIQQISENTFIVLPELFLEFEDACTSISSQLQKTVLLFSIHDSDFWSVCCYENGQFSYQFNPNPNYFEDDDNSLKSKNFSLENFCNQVNCSKELIENYFVEWNLVKRKKKAYKTDEFQYNDGLQLYDLLKKIGITYDVIASPNENDTFKIFTKSFPLKEKEPEFSIEEWETEKKAEEDAILKTRRYTKNYLAFDEATFEYLLSLSYRTFYESSTRNQICDKCHSYDLTAICENTESYLLIDNKEIINDKTFLSPIVIVKGYCNKCGKSMRRQYGVATNRLIEVLNTPYHLNEKILNIIKQNSGITLDEIESNLNEDEKPYLSFEVSRLKNNAQIGFSEKKLYPIIRVIEFFPKKDSDCIKEVKINNFIAIKDLRESFGYQENDPRFFSAYKITDTNYSLFKEINDIKFDFANNEYYFKSYLYAYP